MTESNATVTARRTDAGPQPGDDPRPVFAKAAALAGSVIEQVRPEQFQGPTPCTEFDVQALLAHLVGVARRVGVVGRGRDPLGPEMIVEGVPDDGWGAAWEAAAQDAEAAWRDDAVLDRDAVLPWATMPGRAALAIYVAEVTLHTWDLAVATHQQPAWDDQVVGAALATMQRALPADYRGDDIPFGPVVEVAAGAPIVEQLAGWTGRRP